jgi:hypothetical protein
MGTFRTFNHEVEVFTTSLDHAQFKAVPEIESSSKTIKPWPEIGCGGWHIHRNPLSDLGATHS